MSFDLYISSIDPLPSGGLPREQVRSLLPIDESKSEVDVWYVVYDEQNSSTIFVDPSDDNATRLKFININRPCGDIRLWDAIFAMLRLAPAALYFPATEIRPIIADSAFAVLLDEFHGGSAEPPRLVTSGKEIRDIVSES